MNSSKHSWNIELRKNFYSFGSLKELMAKATPFRSGDVLAKIAAHSQEERIAAQICLSEVPLNQFLEDLLIPYELDEITRLIIDTHDKKAFELIKDLTVGEFREFLLEYETDTAVLSSIQKGLTPEMVAAVSKIMGNQDLILVASKCNVVTKFNNTIGLKGNFSTRIQPNHPSDDLKGIAASMIDGLMYGIGDAVIGINPATDSMQKIESILNLANDVINEYEIPTQSCVLTHITNIMELMQRNVPVDLVFQSIAGTQEANRGFGVDLSMIREAQDMALSLKRGKVGNNLMYFETGQGTALSAEANYGVDMQTCEARAYAIAREFSPLLVNTVVGFIGPEYLYDGKQVTRAGLEDHFCGKLLGIPMGCDVCYTNHANIDQDDQDNLLTLLASAGLTFIMGIPGWDDIMLGNQTTSYHDCHYIRQLLSLRPAPEFEAWLEKIGIQKNLKLNNFNENRILNYGLIAQ
ncbi:MAG: ethanolamine ammonia-lyase subunit EutB [Opitutales bacterium]